VLIFTGETVPLLVGSGAAGMHSKSNTCFTAGMARSTFPDDLMQVQREWDRVYRALAAPRPYGTAELRRRLLQLSARIFTDPAWGTGRPSTGWAELRHQARLESRAAERHE
jgi:hypothetical protein